MASDPDERQLAQLIQGVQKLTVATEQVAASLSEMLRNQEEDRAEAKERQKKFDEDQEDFKKRQKNGTSKIGG